MESLIALEEAISLAGGQSELARRLQALGFKVKQQNIDYWVRVAKRTPAEFARGIEQAVEGRVTRYQLRADVFGADPQLEAAA